MERAERGVLILSLPSSSCVTCHLTSFCSQYSFSTFHLKGYKEHTTRALLCSVLIIKTTHSDYFLTRVFISIFFSCFSSWAALSFSFFLLSRQGQTASWQPKERAASALCAPSCGAYLGVLHKLLKLINCADKQLC